MYSNKEGKEKISLLNTNNILNCQITWGGKGRSEEWRGILCKMTSLPWGCEEKWKFLGWVDEREGNSGWRKKMLKFQAMCENVTEFSIVWNWCQVTGHKILTCNGRDSLSYHMMTLMPHLLEEGVDPRILTCCQVGDRSPWLISGSPLQSLKF